MPHINSSLLNGAGYKNSIKIAPGLIPPCPGMAQDAIGLHRIALA
jgi:hypothetical protein